MLFVTVRLKQEHICAFIKTQWYSFPFKCFIWEKTCFSFYSLFIHHQHEISTVLISVKKKQKHWKWVWHGTGVKPTCWLHVNTQRERLNSCVDIFQVNGKVVACTNINVNFNWNGDAVWVTLFQRVYFVFMWACNKSKEMKEKASNCFSIHVCTRSWGQMWSSE